jgi:hypothetical protein
MQKMTCSAMTSNSKKLYAFTRTYQMYIYDVSLINEKAIEMHQAWNLSRL